MVRTPVIFSNKLSDKLTFTKTLHLEYKVHGLFALFEKKEKNYKKLLPQSRSWLEPPWKTEHMGLVNILEGKINVSQPRRAWAAMDDNIHAALFTTKTKMALLFIMTWLIHEKKKLYTSLEEPEPPWKTKYIGLSPSLPPSFSAMYFCELWRIWGCRSTLPA